MAATLQPLRFTARSCTCRELLHQYASKPIGKRRALSTTVSRFNKKPSSTTRKSQLDPIDPLKNLRQSNEQLGQLLASHTWDAEEQINKLTELEDGPTFSAPNLEKPKKKKPKDTFLNYGDPDPWEEDGQVEDDHDDITSLGHGELEKHREMRHYARLAAWEMPLLANMAKTFEPPTKEMPLRFRYTSYMGESHPAERKVVVEFSPADMPDLTDIQREKLKKLVGVRYNPEKDIVKMSCESFETQAQNKRYLGDLIGKLLHESRTGDTFEDVPLDLRHHRVKPRPKFPREWALTEERKAELARIRLEDKQRDELRALSGSLVDGLKQIEQGVAQASLKEAIPELVPAGRGKKVSVRR